MYFLRHKIKSVPRGNSNVFQFAHKFILNKTQSVVFTLFWIWFLWHWLEIVLRTLIVLISCMFYFRHVYSCFKASHFLFYFKLHFESRLIIASFYPLSFVLKQMFFTCGFLIFSHNFINAVQLPYFKVYVAIVNKIKYNSKVKSFSTNKLYRYCLTLNIECTSFSCCIIVWKYYFCVRMVYSQNSNIQINKIVNNFETTFIFMSHAIW